MRKLLLILLLTLPSTLAAQRMGLARFSGHSSGFNRPGFARTYYPIPFADSLYTDYAAYPAPAQPFVIVMQPQSPAATPDPPRPPQPLMIELQGDRYVQISGDEASSSQMLDHMTAAQPNHAAATITPNPQPAATVLIFRDGHRQEVSAYTIADNTLYAAADYYNSGAWNQTIALSSLNLQETIAANQSRGVRFRLPSAPNEVIVGP